MKNSIVFTSFLLVFISFFCSGGLFAQKKTGKKVEIFIESFEGEKRVDKVDFQLFKNEEELISTTAKNGRFSFLIDQMAGLYRLVIKKEGYLTKEIIFDTKSFPFEKEYDYQDLYIEFIPLKKSDEDYVYRGEMIYAPESRAYKVQKVDSNIYKMKKHYDEVVARLERIYNNAVENGDGLAQLEEYGYAKDFYKLALEAKPDDEYAKLAILRMDSLESEVKLIAEAEKEKAYASVDTVPTEKEKEETADTAAADNADEGEKLQESEYYSVQLGAFHDWYDESAFTEVPGKIVAQGSDYKRVLSGRFNDRDKARKRMTEMKAAGFPDAFLVTMRGEERIGF